MFIAKQLLFKQHVYFKRSFKSQVLLLKFHIEPRLDYYYPERFRDWFYGKNIQPDVRIHNEGRKGD